LFVSASVANYNRINEWPLQFLRTGHYHLSYGYLRARTADGIWWSGTARSATQGHHLSTWVSDVYAQDNSWRGGGFALRYVVAPVLPTTIVSMNGLSSSCVLVITAVPMVIPPVA